MLGDIVVGVEFLGVCRQGQTLPVYVRSESGEVYLVKHCSKRSGLTSRELAIEVVCNRLAASMGIFVAEPSPMLLSDACRAEFERVLDTTLSEEYVLALEFLELAPFGASAGDIWYFVGDHGIMALDILIANGDRSPENPNLAWHGGRVMAFDHEHCLEFPRALSDEERFVVHLTLVQACMRSHVLQSLDTDLVIAELSNLEAAKIVSIAEECRRLPELWLSVAKWETDYLLHVVHNMDALTREVRRSGA